MIPDIANSLFWAISFVPNQFLGSLTTVPNGSFTDTFSFVGCQDETHRTRQKVLTLLPTPLLQTWMFAHPWDGQLALRTATTVALLGLMFWSVAPLLQPLLRGRWCGDSPFARTGNGTPGPGSSQGMGPGHAMEKGSLATKANPPHSDLHHPGVSLQTPAAGRSYIADWAPRWLVGLEMYKCRLSPYRKMYCRWWRMRCHSLDLAVLQMGESWMGGWWPALCTTRPMATWADEGHGHSPMCTH